MVRLSRRTALKRGAVLSGVLVSGCAEDVGRDGTRTADPRPTPSATDTETHTPPRHDYEQLLITNNDGAVDVTVTVASLSGTATPGTVVYSETFELQAHEDVRRDDVVSEPGRYRYTVETTGVERVVEWAPRSADEVAFDGVWVAIREDGVDAGRQTNRG